MDISAILEKIAILQARLDGHNETIKELRAHGQAWALDCRRMRIAEHNASYIFAEIQALKAGIAKMVKVSADSQKSEYELQFEAFIARC